MAAPQTDNSSDFGSIRPGAEGKALLKASTEMAKVILAVAEMVEKRRADADWALERLQHLLTIKQLQEIETEQLRTVIDGSIRLSSVAERYPTVGDLAEVNATKLQAIDGVGVQTANKVMAAVGVIEGNVRQSIPIRISTDNQSAEYGNFVQAAWRLHLSKELAQPFLDRYLALAPRLNELVRTAAPMASRLRFLFRGTPARSVALEAAQELARLLTHETPSVADLRQLKSALVAITPSIDEAWRAFASNPHSINQVLAESGRQREAPEATQGYLPGDIARHVNAQQLDTSLLKATLRGYQAFGARFALAQQRTILGDDMGLGKTVEALAAACHLSAKGEIHILVVSPASVLVNWLHETTKHTHLETFRLHGNGLAAELDSWVTSGGVAVTTFGTLRSFEIPPDLEISLLVVDEAHFVKNLEAKRTQAVIATGRRSNRVLYMTGTPMENRLDEFKSLIAQLQPEVLERISNAGFLAGADVFRPLVAPVYLRRNQADVLSELPERIDVAEWLEFGEGDAAAYRRAVASSNFMAMRQAAYALGNPDGSAKLARLVELVDQVSEQNRKVIVFSFFRSVLTVVAETLGTSVIGPITGDVTPQQRQALVDEFTNREGPAVLVAQVIAGGVGLNIQAASVVIMAEPQIKPSMEEQAIARSHRMGQTRTVYVHKLLVENSVDERMLEILAEKQRLFDEYAVGSTLKDAADAAIDTDNVDDEALAITPQLQNEIIRRERERLGLPEVEVLEPT